MKVLSVHEWSADLVLCGGCTSALNVGYDDLELVKLSKTVKIARFVCPVCRSINKISPPSLVIERLESDARAAESDEGDVQE